MTGERTRGAILYTTAGVLVAGGATWWTLAAPPSHSDDPLDQRRATVEQLLPDVDGQADASTLTLAAGSDNAIESKPLDTASYRISLICRGASDTSVRVSMSRSGPDSGMGVPCSEGRQPDSFEVGLAGAMRLNVRVGDEGVVIFRYSIQRVID
ncbi:hypothetical protein KOI35_06935 [Actinoplanes bogorensis]|uniref:Uncharacterized protein n=1 Tax=Paractinoplanes bogorensis TaxID=1610840 RepID=A0ABS5YIR6_9ACTN|nr:DUF6023 family protein [Actinoplanes bogorensis]MBU2663241.1 hypothetical protein [Actinoplanes bogorensis]